MERKEAFENEPARIGLTTARIVTVPEVLVVAGSNARLRCRIR